MKIYLAHPITGLSGEEVFTYYDEMRKTLSPYYEILCPMMGKNSLRTSASIEPDGYTFPLATNHAIFNRDKWMVKLSDVVFCDFTGSDKASIGCCMELAIAATLGKYIVVVMDKQNIHNHAFIKEAASVIYENSETALSYLTALSESIARCFECELLETEVRT